MELPVEKILKEKMVPYTLIRLGRQAITVGDVVAYSDGAVKTDEICKTIIVKGKKTGALWAILLRGNDRLDFSKTKGVLGEAAEIADIKSVKKVSGVEPGAVCPFMVSVPLFLDKRVLELKRMNVGSGDHLYGLDVAVADIAEGILFTVVDVVK
jgi:prolyl-tRNA editing enzyme YbaK/EbsC (Cys-tRNA(Pro) deacylase)